MLALDTTQRSAQQEDGIVCADLTQALTDVARQSANVAARESDART